ncbi:MAG: hypothetical protein ACFFCT_12555 [Candidatus Odinarchaeota archaeon]
MSRMNLMIPILAILIATIFLPDVSFCLKCEIASFDVQSRPMIQEFHSALDSEGFLLTWASNWNFEFQPVYNNTILIGDQLVFVGRSISPPVINHTLIGFPILLFVFVITILLSVIMIYRHRHRTDVFD